MNTINHKTADWWKLNNQGVQCLLCPHNCLLSEGKMGICNTRQNINNELITWAYGNLCASNIDPVEKKPLFHFFPGSSTLSIATNGCNLRCLNCQNNYISQSSPLDGHPISAMPKNIVKLAVKHGCKSISYTYTEPAVFYEFMLNTAIVARELGILNIMVSSGYINPDPLAQLTKYLDAANIDLKSFDDNVYRKLCGASLKHVLTTLESLLKSNVWLEITYLLIPGWTDDFENIKKMCKWLYANGYVEVPLHFSKFYPAHNLNKVGATPTLSLEKAYAIAKECGLKYVYIGNLSNNANENTFCNSCGKIVISRLGNCLQSININNSKCVYCNEFIAGVF